MPMCGLGTRVNLFISLKIVGRFQPDITVYIIAMNIHEENFELESASNFQN